MSSLVEVFEVSQPPVTTRYSECLQGTLGDQSMRLFLACAIIITATIGLGGCFGHHEKAVATQPLKLG